MKLAKIFLAVVALFAMSCGEKIGGGGTTTPTVNWGNEGSIIGDWELTSFDGSNEAKPRIYIAFYEDNTFEMYQQAYSVVWYRYEGTFNFDGTTLSGLYSDGKPLSAEYAVSFAKEPSRMRLIRKDNDNDISIYTENEIPVYIKDEAIEPQNVRSVTIERFL
jgi:hypothetical protein